MHHRARATDARYGIWNILSARGGGGGAVISCAYGGGRRRAKRVPRYPSCPLDKRSVLLDPRSLTDH